MFVRTYMDAYISIVCINIKKYIRMKKRWYKYNYYIHILYIHVYYIYIYVCIYIYIYIILCIYLVWFNIRMFRTCLRTRTCLRARTSLRKYKDLCDPPELRRSPTGARTVRNSARQHVSVRTYVCSQACSKDMSVFDITIDS